MEEAKLRLAVVRGVMEQLDLHMSIEEHAGGSPEAQAAYLAGVLSAIRSAIYQPCEEPRERRAK